MTNGLLIPLMSGVTVTLIIIILIVIALALWGVSMYNSLVRLRNQVQEAWNQVDVELQRRHDLIPNLVETTKGYAGHERNTLEQVVALRNQAVQMGHGGQQVGPTAQQAQVENELSQAVNRLLVTVEAYPDLKSNQNFIELQRSLTETEDRIAAGRRYFNANVRAYNTKIESFPTNFIAGMGHFEKANYFEVTDAETRQSQKVDFGPMSEVGPTVSQQQAHSQGQQSFGQSYQQAYPPAQPVDPGQRGPFANSSSGQGGMTQASQQPVHGETKPIEQQGSYEPAPSFDQQPTQQAPAQQQFQPQQQNDPYGQLAQPSQPAGGEQNGSNPYGTPQNQNPYGNPQQ